MRKSGAEKAYKKGVTIVNYPKYFKGSKVDQRSVCNHIRGVLIFIHMVAEYTQKAEFSLKLPKIFFAKTSEKRKNNLEWKWIMLCLISM